MKIEQIRKLTHFADDYNFNIQEPIMGLGMYNKYMVHFDEDNLTLTYCSPFSMKEEEYFIRCGSNILFQGSEVKNEIDELMREIDSIVAEIKLRKENKINNLINKYEIEL